MYKLDSLDKVDVLYINQTSLNKKPIIKLDKSIYSYKFIEFLIGDSMTVDQTSQMISTDMISISKFITFTIVDCGNGFDSSMDLEVIGFSFISDKEIQVSFFRGEKETDSFLFRILGHSIN